MQLTTGDWAVIGGFFLLWIVIGVAVSRRAGKDSSQFFLSGRSMPWWLLGVSMVATTFSTDTPNLVTDITRTGGVAGNWAWWAFLLTGMLTTFVYARLWRRSNALTDIEFYELRYSGKIAAFLRGFRAVYLGVFFNVVTMGGVSLAAIKIGQVMFGMTPVQTVLIAGTITVVYAMLGGLTGVLITDLIQFSVALFGAFAAAYYAISHPQVESVGALLSHPNVSDKIGFLPSFDDPALWVPLLLIPLAVQWWAAYYPGAEPGGGGYVAQRMLAARDESNAQGATLLFNVAHYAIRPWPWILVALASLVVFPQLISPGDDRELVLGEGAEAIGQNVTAEQRATFAADLAAMPDSPEKDRLTSIVAEHPEALEVAALASLYAERDPTNSEHTPLFMEGLVHLRLANPDLPFDKLGQDLAYPAMLTFLPPVLLGVVVASLIAAFMSTISTHLNWGSSYMAYDVYRRFLKPDASEKELVLVGRVSTLLLMVLAMLFALSLANARQAFDILIQIGAGTGLLFILRWFWWRINAWSELTAMVVSLVVAIGFHFVETGWPGWQELLLSVAITTVSWVAVTFATSPTDPKTLRSFYRAVAPGGPGWMPVLASPEATEEGLAEIKPTVNLKLALGCMALGCLVVYGALFATGSFLYGAVTSGMVLAGIAAASAFALVRLWPKLGG